MRMHGKVLLQLRPGALACAFLLVLLSACATPIGVSPASQREVQRELTRSAITSGTPSAPTEELLTRLGVRERYEAEPDETLALLRAGLSEGETSDRLYALAELSFLRGEATGNRAQVLAAAVYAYAFLFPPASEPFHPFDPRVLVARNLYNLGLTRAFAGPEPQQVLLEAGRFELPFGTLDVAFDPAQKHWAGFELDRFAAAADFRVRGFANRYRHAGLGAPLSASLGAPAPGEAPLGRDHIPPRLKVPVTAFLRLSEPRSQITSQQLAATLELYSEEEATEVDGRRIPLEVEKSSALAYTLEGAAIWDYGFAGFRLGDYLPVGPVERLIFLHPFRPGRIPLVLVHGTFSSPATWAQLVNELENDPEVSQRYQVWLFIYNSGNPIQYSAGILAESLRDTLRELDPEAHDAALRHMVVAGHSQGGLLTRLTAVNSGDSFWRNVSDRPFESFDFTPEDRELLQRSLYYERLPFVERLIYLSTPHHGSYLSSYSVSSLVSRLVKLPGNITRLGYDLATKGQEGLLLRSLEKPPTSLDNMRPGSPFLMALAELPTAPGVTTHSIIPVKGDGPLEDESDGVVRYESAHRTDVESELVVRHSGHSVQERPEGIREVRRILLEHAGIVSQQGR